MKHTAAMTRLEEVDFMTQRQKKNIILLQQLTEKCGLPNLSIILIDDMKGGEVNRDL